MKGKGKAKVKKGCVIKKPKGKAAYGPQVKSRTFRTQHKTYQRAISGSRKAMVFLDVDSYADLRRKLAVELSAPFVPPDGHGAIRMFKVSLSTAELDERDLALWKDEKRMKEHYVNVSERMAQDSTIPIVDYSMRVEDKDGSVLLQNYSFDADNCKIYNGIPIRRSNKLVIDMQALMSTFPNGKRSCTGDSRHDKDTAIHRFFQYTGHSLKYIVNDADGNTKVVFEPAIAARQEGNGLLHLCQAWPEQGHSNNIKASVDFIGANSSRRQQAVGCFLCQTYPLAKQISLQLRAVDPKLHDEMMKSFKAGKSVDNMPGPYLGCACLYKLQVSLHKDNHDFGLSAMTNAGAYDGGILHVPQLGIKLSYRPGDVVFIASAHLYHEVREWKAHVEPAKGAAAHPGRVSLVFFTHRIAHEELKDKPEGWLMQTGNQQSYEES